MGQIPFRFGITNISNALPCVVTTDVEHGMKTGDYVRLTNLNGVMPIPHGEDQLNNNRYRIVVLSVDSFFLVNPITGKKIDSTNFTPYVNGGSCNKIAQSFIYYNDNDNAG